MRSGFWYPFGMEKRESLVLEPITGEFEGAALGDVRRTKRLQTIAKSLAKEPEASVPQAAGSDAALEGCYRFLNNDAVSPESILQPHQRRTVERASCHAEVLVAHDTTTLRICDEDTREGLGPLLAKNGKRGFFAHVSLVVTATESADPLGVIGLETYTRAEERVYTKRQKTLQDPANEYGRWGRAADAAERALNGATSAIHVMDREADIYELFNQFVRDGQRFVIRASDNRATPQPIEGTKSHIKVSEVLEGLQGVATREVPLSPRTDKGRTPSAKKIHSARAGRIATLRFSAVRIDVARSGHLPKALPPKLSLHMIHVLEVDPPAGDAPVEWRLWTTEPIDTVDQVLKVVDFYRARWRIEELFKALKTGCAFEKRQFRTYIALRRVLAVLLPVAWRILRIRTLARSEPDRAATEVLSERQIAVLRATTKRGPLPINFTVHDALYAVAALGGHLKRNGPPGWQTLGRGFDELLSREIGWAAARGEDM